MAPFRNPFARRPGVFNATEDQLHPEAVPEVAQPGFEKVDTVGSKASSALSIRSWRSERSMDNGDYKMSVVNDSGVYLPPSPIEEKGLWPRHYESSRKSTETKSSLGEIEPFGISRESFDTYRRSFDVSARSPVTHEPPARASFDCSRFPRPPRSALDSHRRPFEAEELPAPEEFEDVGLEDKLPTIQPPVTKKRGFFSKFTTTNTTPEASASEGQAAMTRWIIGGGRKHTTSNSQGSELKSMEKPIFKITPTTVHDDGKIEEVETPTETQTQTTVLVSA